VSSCRFGDSNQRLRAAIPDESIDKIHRKYPEQLKEQSVLIKQSHGYSKNATEWSKNAIADHFDYPTLIDGASRFIFLVGLRFSYIRLRNMNRPSLNSSPECEKVLMASKDHAIQIFNRENGLANDKINLWNANFLE